MNLLMKSIVTGCVAIVLIVATLSGCSREPKRPNVILISVDTLRPDHLGYNGSSRPTSPTIDQLAKEGVVFSNAYSVSGWTLPSMATIHSGHYPRDHGATDFHWSMDVTLTTLAGILRRNDYDTRAFVSHIILKPSYGLAQGFISYDYSVLDVGHPHEVASATQLTNIAIDGLETLKPPYFLWLHYFDPHFAYLEHPQWRSFGASEKARYDQEIAHTDYNIARLFDALETKKLDKNTIIVFTADHGEEFNEHDGYFHYTLYDEVLRVPLIVKAPSLTPRVDEQVVEQTDVLPTIMELLGIDWRNGQKYPGRDLFADKLVEPRAAFSERDRPPPFNQRSVRYGDKKLTVIELADTTHIPRNSRGTYVDVKNVVPGIYMYDLANDPLEQNNIYSDDNPEAIELMVMLATHFGAEPARAREVQIDDTLRDKLRSLGYIR